MMLVYIVNARMAVHAVLQRMKEDDKRSNETKVRGGMGEATTMIYCN